MIKAVRTLFGLALREDATSAELIPSLPAAEAELAAAEDAHADAEEIYRAAFLTADDGELLKLDTGRREAAVRVERTTAMVSTLRERLSAAQAREAEAARIERYEAARRQSQDAAAALVELYPQFAQALVDLLEGVMRAEIEIIAVNEDLPKDTPRLPMIEREIRSATNGGWIPPLGETLSLPSLRACEPWFYKPLERPFQANTQPRDVLQRIGQRIT